MVHKTLPKTLVRRLRKITKAKDGVSNVQFNKMLERLKNADHRVHNYFIPPSSTHGYGGRVRALSVKINYPQVGTVIIKKSHFGGTARQELMEIREAVENHNKRHPDSPYILKKPIAYPISTKHIAMAYAEFPALSEIIVDGRKTNRGLKFYGDLLKKNPNNKRLTIGALEKCADLIRERVNVDNMPMGPRNYLFIGVKNGKPVFIPLIDAR